MMNSFYVLAYCGIHGLLHACPLGLATTGALEYSLVLWASLGVGIWKGGKIWISRAGNGLISRSLQERGECLSFPATGMGSNYIGAH